MTCVAGNYEHDECSVYVLFGLRPGRTCWVGFRYFWRGAGLKSLSRKFDVTGVSWEDRSMVLVVDNRRLDEFHEVELVNIRLRTKTDSATLWWC